MRCRLYLITPPTLEAEDFLPVLSAALDAGDVATVQLRLKDVPDKQVLKTAERLMPAVQERDVAFLINDRPDLAAEIGADGAHIGQEDMEYGEARRLLGPNRILGVTCHDSRHLGMVAAEKGADYVAFGAFFPTATKTPKTRAQIELLEWWSSMCETPSVAIGGIKLENAEALVAAGADFLAVSAGVWTHPSGPAKAVAAFNDLFDRLAEPVS